MKELLELLQRKNICFRNFQKICGEFLDKISHDDTSEIEEFSRKRGVLLKVLEQLESRIALILSDPALTQTLDDRAQQNILALSRAKAGLLQSILDLDLQISKHIERIKDETIQNLQKIQNGRKSIAGYKSPLNTLESAERKQGSETEA